MDHGNYIATQQFSAKPCGVLLRKQDTQSDVSMDVLTAYQSGGDRLKHLYLS